MPDATTIHGPAGGHHDLIGIGLGPFNLGLAALAEPLDDVDAVFFDQRDAFAWHAGLLLEGTTLQVPFLADLVTLADPTSPYSFLNYLHGRGRLLRFYFHESFFVPRREYDAYCRWVAGQLPSCHFGHRVVSVSEHDGDGGWTVQVESAGVTTTHTADHVVFGVGTRPTAPPFVCDHLGDHLGDHVVHTADYLRRREALVAESHVTVIGSGQSAAEAVLDLLRARSDDRPLDWFTRSDGFLPMEYSKLGLEHFTPEYGTHFHGLDESTRDSIRAEQDLLYKGISSETSAAIFDQLYERSIDGDDLPVTYAAASELTAIEPDPNGGSRFRLTYRHLHDGTTFQRSTDAVVLGTGYEPAPLPLGDSIDLVATDSQGRPVVELDYRLRLTDGTPSTLFVQNAELHTHGVGTPDLGLGTHRNAVILNAVTGRDAYAVHDRNVFQTFGPPENKVEP